MTAWLCVVQSSACAQTINGDAWEASSGVGYRQVYEETDSGSRLLTEKGPLAVLQLGTEFRSEAAGVWRVGFGLRAADLDYDGQTQDGVPLETTTGYEEWEASVLWRPRRAAAWGELALGTRALYQRREIAPTRVARGLTETSTLLMPGVLWRGPAAAIGAWSVQPQAAVWSSVRHRLRVHYQGAFDDSRLAGARRTELVLGLAAYPVDSAWRFSAEWTRARQPASEREPLYRAGVQVGTVRQPRLGFDDFTLSVGRSF